MVWEDAVVGIAAADAWLGVTEMFTGLEEDCGEFGGWRFLLGDVGGFAAVRGGGRRFLGARLPAFIDGLPSLEAVPLVWAGEEVREPAGEGE